MSEGGRVRTASGDGELAQVLRLMPPVLLYAAVIVLLAHHAGVPLLVPREKVNPALGFSPALPAVVAIGGYLLAQSGRLLWTAAAGERELVMMQIRTDCIYLALFVLVAYLHFFLKLQIPLLRSVRFDPLYHAMDQRMTGFISLLAGIRAAVARYLPDADQWYQTGQLALYLLSFWFHALGHRRWHHRAMTAFLLNLMMGSFAYLLAPAVGPFLYEHGPNEAATGAQSAMGWLFRQVRDHGAPWVAAHGGGYLTSAVAAMPSLHVSAACIASYYAVRARLICTPLILFLAFWIGIEAVVSRWHYLADIPAGVLFASLVILLANRLSGPRQERREQRLSATDHKRTHPPLPLSARPVSRTPPETFPEVWAVLCYRAGENAQIRALAEALGWPFTIKRLAYRRLGRLIDVWRGTNLWGIDRRRSSPLEPPWPDLVISSGMRNEPVCRWIRRQSGGRTRYVHIGKPWGNLDRFDLIISVPEYPLPSVPNMLRNRLSLHRITADRLAAAAGAFGPRVAHLPKPHIAVLVGGYSGPYSLDPPRARALARAASAMAAERGGSLLLTTSARTSRRAARALAESLDVPHMFHAWRADDPENPYLAFLALADALIVTCESATMLAEACATAKPVFMFDLGLPPPAACVHGIRERIGDPDDLRALLYRQIMWRFAPRRITRDIRTVHRFLKETGRAVWLGEPFPGKPPPPLDEMPATIARIRALLGLPEVDRQRDAA